MKLAWIGLGSMGSVIAALLLKSGHQLTVWNRTAEKALPLANAGATIAATPEQAVRETEIVFTMLIDDASLEATVLGTDNAPGILQALPAGAIHLCLSTISVALSRRLTAEHARAGSEFVAAPVFGRPNVAAEGKLWIVVAGKEPAVARVRPLLEAVSRGLTVVSSEPWRAHALKIGGNFLITAMIESLSEALVFAEAHGLDPAIFLETVNSALFRSPFYEAYGKVMLTPPEHPGATIALGAKDMALFREAARDARIETPLADEFAGDLSAAAESGLQNQDWAAGLYQFARGANLPAR
jgi:3-hydroxyisobutyrate dehydrogenase-like beta-hydroxyacid dehydrogenase